MLPSLKLAKELGRFTGSQFTATDSFQNLLSLAGELVLLLGFKSKVGYQVIDATANYPVGDAKLTFHLLYVAAIPDEDLQELSRLGGKAAEAAGREAAGYFGVAESTRNTCYFNRPSTRRALFQYFAHVLLLPC